MSTSSRGASRERQARKLLESEGWAVTRGAGSHGCADLWCAMAEPQGTFEDAEMTREHIATHLRLIQVKGNTGSPYKNFSPSERLELSSLAKQTGGTAELWHWPPRKPNTIYLESDWPSVRQPKEDAA